MKKTAKEKKDADIMQEYDFRHGVRGKYVKRLAGGSNIVVLAPDVAKFFPDSRSVNSALRQVVHLQGQRKNKLVRSRTE